MLQIAPRIVATLEVKATCCVTARVQIPRRNTTRARDGPYLSGRGDYLNTEEANGIWCSGNMLGPSPSASMSGNWLMT